MIELLSMYNGSNNGRLFLSLRDATDRLGFSDWRAADSAFADLEAAGLITMTLESYFQVKTSVHSRARAWRLNWIGDDGERLAPEALPALDERKLESRAQKRLQRRQKALKRYFKGHDSGKFAAVDTTTLEPRMPENRPEPAVVSTMFDFGNSGKQLKQEMKESTAHLSYQEGMGISLGPWAVDARLRAIAVLKVAVACASRDGMTCE